VLIAIVKKETVDEVRADLEKIGIAPEKILEIGDLN
jgi:nitrogen regulatory protein PII